MQNYVDRLKTKPTEVMVTDRYLCLSADSLYDALKICSELRQMGVEPQIFACQVVGDYQVVVGGEYEKLGY